jgi:hypothetical protein
MEVMRLYKKPLRRAPPTLPVLLKYFVYFLRAKRRTVKVTLRLIAI